MPRRFAPLTPPALLLALGVLLAGAGDVSAHRLVVECHVLPDRKIQVEGWYNSPSNPHPAQEAKVEVFRPDGGQLIEGRLDVQGVFVFPFEQAEALKVVVYQTGHREEVTIPAAALAPAPSPELPATVSPASSGTIQPITISSGEHELRDWIKEVLIGVGFILALAAFVMSLRNTRRLREWERGRQE